MTGTAMVRSGLCLEIRARQRLGDHRRLAFAFNLDADLAHLLNHVRLNFVHADQFGSGSNPLADVHRADEAHAVETVIDAHATRQTHGDALAAIATAKDERRRRKRPETMRDRAAKGPLAGAFGIDVDPLVITGCIGECIDLFLSDYVPIAHAGLFAEILLELVDG